MSSTMQDRTDKEQQKSKRNKKHDAVTKYIKADAQNTLKVTGLVTHTLSDVDSKKVLEIYRLSF